MRRILLPLIFIVSFPVAVYGQEKSPLLEQRLETSRNLIRKFEIQYTEISRKSGIKNTPELQRKKELLERKLQMLREEHEKAIEELPDNLQAVEFLKDTMAKKNVYRLKKSDESQKTDAVSLHNKALKLSQEEKYGEAIQIYQEILLQNPNDDQAYLIMGHLYLLTWNVQEAERAFFNAIDIDPSNRNEIIPFYQNLAMHNPNDSNYVYLGFANLILGDVSRAKEAFGQALELNPGNEKALGALQKLKIADATA